MIEEKTSLGSDPCYQKTADEQSVGVGNYNLNNHYNCGCGAKSTEEVAMEQPSVIFRDGYGFSWNGWFTKLIQIVYLKMAQL